MSQKAYFENISNVIKSELAKACHTIKIAVAWIKDDSIIKVLENKALEGVLIELLLVDDEINRSSSIHYNEHILKHVIIYKIAASGDLMHNKFCIIDDKIVITGSYNWTNKAQNNFENIIVVEQKDTVDNYCNEFEKLKGELGISLSSGTYDKIVINYDTHLNLARNKVKQKLFIEASKDYIFLMNNFPNQEEVYRELYSIQNQLKHYNGAIKTWEKYQDNFSEHFEAHVRKIDLYNCLKDHRSVEKEIETAIKSCPSHTDYLISRRADLWFDQIKVTKGTIQKTFEFHSSINGLNSYYEEQRKNNLHYAFLALKDFEEALNLDTKCETVNFKKLKIAELKFYLGDFHEAKKIFEELFDNGYTYAYNRYISLLHDNEQFKNALKYSRAALFTCKNDFDHWWIQQQIEDNQRKLSFWEKIF